MKATATANANAAIVKYWGKKDEKLKIPMNNSVSVTLDKNSTTVTVEFSKDYERDIGIINGVEASEKVWKRGSEQLDIIRKMSNIDLKAKAVAQTNFPIEVGLSSSSSGFAALTLAACTAASLEPSEKELSIITRQGSGSSCRSIYGGYVKWLTGEKSKDSYAVQIADEDYFDICDTIAIISIGKRTVDTRGGMKIAKETSPYYKNFVKEMNREAETAEKAIIDRDFNTIGKIAEHSSLMLHATAITAQPALIYLKPETVTLMHEVISWREEGLNAYFSIETGSNAHIFSLPENAKEVKKRLRDLNGIKEIIVNRPGGGARILNKHLF